jgi:hypothetical protein
VFQLGVLALLCGCCLPPVTISAQEKTPPATIRDEANLFSKEAIERAQSLIAEIGQRHHKELRIDTLEKGPEATEMKAWAAQRFRDLRVDGVYIVITKDPRKFEVVFGNKTREQGVFTQADCDELVKLLRGLGKDRDGVLLQVIQQTRAAMDINAAAKRNWEKLLIGKWLGPSVEFMRDDVKVRGQVFFNFTEKKGSPYLTIGYTGPDGSLETQKTHEVRLEAKGGQRQIFVKRFMGENDLVLTCEIVENALKIAAAPTVSLAGIDGPIDLSGVWKRPTKDHK